MTSVETYRKRLESFLAKEHTRCLSATFSESVAKAKSGTWFYNPMMSKFGGKEKMYSQMLFYKLESWKEMGSSHDESYVNMVFDCAITVNGQKLNFKQSQSNREYDHYMEAVDPRIVAEFCKSVRGIAIGKDVGILSS